jgi:2-methylisocitrate lyase-like PEP mutase family enzyme
MPLASFSERRRAFRAILTANEALPAGSVFDAASARLARAAGYQVGMFAGSVASAVVLGAPDLVVMTLTEFADQARRIARGSDLPFMVDADHGYGNALNVRRTVREYGAAGFAAVMIEDQVAPKRCGHTRGKQVVERPEAVMRIRAACDGRDEAVREGADILILARTDARATHGLEEAIARAGAFAAAGADLLFVEAPRSADEMAAICRKAPGLHLANMLDGGATPVLPPARLRELGFAMAAYPLALLSASIGAMQRALADLAAGRMPREGVPGFGEVRTLLGFDAYDAEAERYAGS